MKVSDFEHGDLSWYKHDRFGMFIHWGLYAMGARHEWLKNREYMNDERYQVYFDLFNPDLFRPNEWAKAAKDAGMKYVVITTKHHEGFCLWDSAYTDYKAPNTPAKRDLLRELVDAFRAEGIKIGFYHSLIDWHHPDFLIDRFHPLRNLPISEIEELNKVRDMRRYRDYLHNQVRELLTNYGKIDIIWFDFSYPQPAVNDGWAPGFPGEKGKGKEDWDSENLLKMVRSLQPGIIVNNRLDLPQQACDISTPEQSVPEDDYSDEEKENICQIWEGCQTFSGSWGYFRDEESWKSPEMCIRLLVDHVSRGGNMIMNVGPTARGTFDDRAMSRLAAYRDWMEVHSRSIYGCGKYPDVDKQPLNCRYTYNEETGRLYIHIFSWPFCELVLWGLKGKVKYAQLLNDASEIFFYEREDNVVLKLPTKPPRTLVPVIELFLK